MSLVIRINLVKHLLCIRQWAEPVCRIVSHFSFFHGYSRKKGITAPFPAAAELDHMVAYMPNLHPTLSIVARLGENIRIGLEIRIGRRTRMRTPLARSDCREPPSPIALKNKIFWEKERGG